MELPSTDTSAYCQARKRLPEKLLQRLFEDFGENLELKVNSLNLWCGRHVKLMDCSTVSMPDTPANQQAYPQSISQQIGCGFPIASICVIFSLITGAAKALAIDILNTNDIKLLEFGITKQQSITKNYGFNINQFYSIYNHASVWG